MFCSFDPFRNNFKVQSVSHGDDSLNNRRIRIVVVDLQNKSSINLNFINRKSVQVGKVRVSGTKIVDCDPDTERAQVFKTLYGFFCVDHQ